MNKKLIHKTALFSIFGSLILKSGIIDIKPVHAVRINDPSFFGTDAITIDFETFPNSTSLIPNNTSLTDQYSSLGVLFSSEDQLNSLQTTDPLDSAGRFEAPFKISRALGGGGSPSSGVRYAGGFVLGFRGFDFSDMRIDFITPVNAFGMVMIDNDFTDVRISAFDSTGNLLESIIAPRVSEGGRSYQGISTLGISYVIIDGKNGGQLDSTFIDDLTFSRSTEVPEPLTILGAGTAIAFGTAFKHKLKQPNKK